MIITLESNSNERDLMETIKQVTNRYEGITLRIHEFQGTDNQVTEIHLIGDTKEIPTTPFNAIPGVRSVVRVSKKYHIIGRPPGGDAIVAGFEYNGIKLDESRVNIFAGLCAVDSRKHAAAMFKALADNDIFTARMGVYKPRTSPYDFQGMGKECLPWLLEMAGKHGIRIITMEVCNERRIDEVHAALEAAGKPTGVMLQVGTRNAQNFELLKHMGQQKELPVLFKRGMGITLEESLNACEYIASEGNSRIVFCLRGVKSHLSGSHRNLVDFAQVPLVRRLTRLPVCIDPSHSVGNLHAAPDGLPDLFHVTGQGILTGASMVLVEFHPDPSAALCDGHQALRFHQIPKLTAYIQRVREAYEAVVAIGAG